MLGYTNPEVIHLHRKQIKYTKLYKILFIILTIFLLSSCQQKEDEEQQNSDREIIPQELASIGKNTEDVIEEIEKLQIIIEKPEKLEEYKDSQQEKDDKQQGEQEKQQGEQDKQQSGEEQQQGEQDKQQSGEEQQQDEQDKQQGEKDQDDKEEGEEKNNQDKEKEETIDDEVNKIWETIENKVKEIHIEWNNFEVKSTENGINQDEISKFEESLNELTIAANNKNDMQSLIMANEVIFATSRFLNYYKGNIDSEMYKIKYYVRMSLIHGQLGEWEKTENDLAETQSILELLRQKIKIEEEDKELLEKLNLSLKDMENVTKHENKELLKIKRDIVLDNLNKLDEAAN